MPVLHAGSTIYKYVDQDGNITFTNRPIKGAQKTRTAPQSSTVQPYVSKVQPVVPKDTANTQNKRDIKRREILQHELATEMKLFSDARKNLSLMRVNDTDYQQNEEFRQLQHKLLRHENNISAIRKELAKL
ncbi:MAG: DUF4124 domain-containing protein [Burkholderiales bacterium]|nr:DUF4124 domain-containing protein [Burkholderiales bacterium]